MAWYIYLGYFTSYSYYGTIRIVLESFLYCDETTVEDNM